ncbi:MAG TPA: 4-(cytidine 5'-diphospho)-2-C-methyl-D-erythritol kinase [Rhizomicrobium sp.]|jgi:4-diphosphocytidyl-2-C-methyl-D-erythritol kinase
MIREIAPAKVNLFLHVGQKRGDGYHDLESLVVFADVGDELSFEPAGELSLEIEGPFAHALANEPDNLILRAAREFARHAQIEQSVKITLTKNLPVASGIGGGSSDAAAALRGLSRLNPGRLSLPQLWNIGHDLGSDVPVCVMPASWWMTGRGERFATVDSFGTFDAVLVNSGAPVATAAAYAGLRDRRGIGAVKRPPRLTTMTALTDYLQPTGNDLEAPARALFPEIATQIAELEKTDAMLARMSGSGATCFGLYADEVRARRAADLIKAEHPGWWVVATKLNRSRKWNFQ